MDRFKAKECFARQLPFLRHHNGVSRGLGVGLGVCVCERERGGGIHLFLFRALAICIKLFAQSGLCSGCVGF